MRGLDRKGPASSIFHDLWLDSKPLAAPFGPTMFRRNCLTQNPGNLRNTTWLVVVAQLVEPQIVVLVVAGSSPVDHPILPKISIRLGSISLVSF
jgi:hypothetical protein